MRTPNGEERECLSKRRIIEQIQTGLFVNQTYYTSSQRKENATGTSTTSLRINATSKTGTVASTLKERGDNENSKLGNCEPPNHFPKISFVDDMRKKKYAISRGDGTFSSRQHSKSHHHAGTNE